MSMIYALRQARDETVTLLLRDPEKILSYLGLVEPDPPAKKRSFFRRLFGACGEDAKEIETAPQNAELDEGAEEVYLDKAWHALHFLYSGSPWEGELPSAFLLKGGAEIGDFDVGYGPARAFRSSEVAAIEKYLEQVDEHALRSAYKPETLSRLQIYPTNWTRTSLEGEPLEYILDYHDLLKSFLSNCVKGSWGIVAYIA